VYAELRADLGRDPLQPIALGSVAAAAGLTPEQAALCALHHQVGTWTTAAIRLLGLDPFAVHADAARLAPTLDRLAGEAAQLADRDPADLPSTSSPLGDILAEHHTTWEVRLFAS
jgi:urease accessory protein